MSVPDSSSSSFSDGSLQLAYSVRRGRLLRELLARQVWLPETGPWLPEGFSDEHPAKPRPKQATSATNVRPGEIPNMDPPGKTFADDYRKRRATIFLKRRGWFSSGVPA